MSDKIFGEPELDASGKMVFKASAELSKNRFIDISFAAKGFGFGHVTLSCRNGAFHVDTEMMDAETVAGIIRAAADDLGKILVDLDIAGKEP